MPKTVISVEHLTKRYDLGVINTGTLSRDLNRWWARVRGKADPYLQIGKPDHGNRSGDSILALNDVNFQVQQGETLGIIGRNGAGKSTLLKILSRVTAPTSGKVKMNGRVGSLLEVGTGFHPELTGRENIYLNGAILGMSRKEVDRKFDEIVDFSGVEQFIDTPVKRYSSGMYVRLGFAVAAHLDPEILIVDEVLAVGDVGFQRKCLGKMNDVSKNEGRTVIFVSHNMASIEFLCQQLLLLSEGAIQYSGNVTDGIHLYIDGFFNKRVDLLSSSNKQRRGLGNIRFTSFRIEDVDGNPIEAIITGMDVFFVFGCTSYKKVDNISIGFGLLDEMGKDLIAHYNDFSNQVIPSMDGEKIIKCKITNFPLNEGSYLIKARIRSNGVEEDNLVDGIGTIEVVKGDFYGTGKVMPKGKRKIPFLVKGDWFIGNERIRKRL